MPHHALATCTGSPGLRWVFISVVSILSEIEVPGMCLALSDVKAWAAGFTLPRVGPDLWLKCGKAVLCRASRASSEFTGSSEEKLPGEGVELDRLAAVPPGIVNLGDRIKDMRGRPAALGR